MFARSEYSIISNDRANENVANLEDFEDSELIEPTLKKQKEMPESTKPIPGWKKRRNIKKHLKKRANYKKGFHNYSFLNAEKYGTITEEEMAVFKNPMYTPGTVTNGTIQEINTNEEFIQLSD